MAGQGEGGEGRTSEEVELSSVGAVGGETAERKLGVTARSSSDLVALTSSPCPGGILSHCCPGKHWSIF